MLSISQHACIHNFVVNLNNYKLLFFSTPYYLNTLQARSEPYKGPLAVLEDQKMRMCCYGIATRTRHTHGAEMLLTSHKLIKVFSKAEFTENNLTSQHHNGGARWCVPAVTPLRTIPAIKRECCSDKFKSKSRCGTFIFYAKCCLFGWWGTYAHVYKQLIQQLMMRKPRATVYQQNGGVAHANFYITKVTVGTPLLPMFQNSTTPAKNLGIGGAGTSLVVGVAPTAAKCGVCVIYNLKLQHPVKVGTVHTPNAQQASTKIHNCAPCLGTLVHRAIIYKCLISVVEGSKTRQHFYPGRARSVHLFRLRKKQEKPGTHQESDANFILKDFFSVYGTYSYATVQQSVRGADLETKVDGRTVADILMSMKKKHRQIQSC
eukprot:TRINITY_DN522_c0_g1_i2.p1 TRINITY_DN522_c0_g1~~TRINITY_DN522_c0_g1_i2.p1  ORF type:complete len:375 (-),score=-18.31 TRINITY_DN522_c0_g1_i2:2806-3930(-)